VADPFDIIKDSSIWYDSEQHAAIHKKDPYVRIGVVKDARRDVSTGDIRYLVEVRDRNDAIEMNCRMVRQFGGVYNYQDVVTSGYKFDDKPDPVLDFTAKAGDAVLVVALNGQSREGIILGGITHPARKSTIPVDKGPYYQSEFNGIETVINDQGEYTLTFKAIPTNIAKLKDKPSKKIEPPKYDKKIGGSFIKLDKTGSIEINDKAEKDLQNIRIDKANGTIAINSGNISIVLTKSKEQMNVKSKIIDIVTENSMSIKTKKYSVDSKESVKIKSDKIAIGKNGVELLDQLSKMLDELGKVKPISPVGPCTPLMATPEWSGVKAVQQKIKEITGSL